MPSNLPTPYSDVNAILDRLHAGLRQILQDQFVGFYLFGSLANGDFDAHSDIDVLVVTQTDLPDEVLAALQTLHGAIAQMDSPWAVQQEISYIPREALRRFDPAYNIHPHLDRGAGEVLQRRSHDSDWVIQRYVLRERGITLFGPALDTLIDPVTPADLRRAVADILHTWIRTFLDDPHRLASRGYQSYTVLTLCRILYTFEHGQILTKRAAAEWAKTHLDPRWAPLIDRAWAGRQNAGLAADPADLQATLDFIRYTLEKIP